MENTENQANQNSNFGIPNKDFDPIEKKSNHTPLLIALILLILLGAGLFYMLYWRPMQEKKHNASQDIEIETNGSENNNDEATTQENTEEATPLPADEEYTSKSVTKKAGSVKLLSERLGMYHVIIGSFIDEDLANDLGKKLAAKGVEVFIIPPPKGKLFFMVSVDRAQTKEEAVELQEMLRSTYKDSRIVKY